MPSKMRFVLKRMNKPVLYGAAAVRQVDQDYAALYKQLSPTERVMLPPPTQRKGQQCIRHFMVLHGRANTGHKDANSAYYKSTFRVWREQARCNARHSNYKFVLTQQGLKYGKKKVKINPYLIPDNLHGLNHPPQPNGNYIGDPLHQNQYQVVIGGVVQNVPMPNMVVPDYIVEPNVVDVYDEVHHEGHEEFDPEEEVN